MKFDYLIDIKSKNSKGGYIKRPMLEVSLINGKRSFNFWGLVDSGADLTIVNLDVADALGVDWKSGKPVSMMGVHGARQECYSGKLSLRINQFKESIEIPVLYCASNVPILLGQEGFFDSYKIKFEKDHDTFEISSAIKKK